MNNPILVLGCCGQIGSELLLALREKYGDKEVIGIYNRTEPSEELCKGPNVQCDVTNKEKYWNVLLKYNPGTVYHMAAILSVAGEKNPERCYRVNNDSTINVLEGAKEFGYSVFIPSSIAAFGPGSKSIVNQASILDPITMYGISKVHGELLADYYRDTYGVDVRGVRYPGIVSWRTEPGGGTTDYSVGMYIAAAKGEEYECNLGKNTRLPFMYMPDAIECAIKLMEAPITEGGCKTGPHYRTNYNVQAFSLTPGELEMDIKKIVEGFSSTYPDLVHDNTHAVVNRIADSWCDEMKCVEAKEDWGFEVKYTLKDMTHDMLTNLMRQKN